MVENLTEKVSSEAEPVLNLVPIDLCTAMGLAESKQVEEQLRLVREVDTMQISQGRRSTVTAAGNLVGNEVPLVSSQHGSVPISGSGQEQKVVDASPVSRRTDLVVAESSVSITTTTNLNAQRAGKRCLLASNPETFSLEYKRRKQSTEAVAFSLPEASQSHVGEMVRFLKEGFKAGSSDLPLQPSGAGHRGGVVESDRENGGQGGVVADQEKTDQELISEAEEAGHIMPPDPLC